MFSVSGWPCRVFVESPGMEIGDVDVEFVATCSSRLQFGRAGVQGLTVSILRRRPTNRVRTMLSYAVRVNC